MLKKYLLVFLFQFFLTNSVFANCDVLRIVETIASDNLISNQLLKKELEVHGYTTEIIPARSSKKAYELLRLNKADIYLGTWIPLDRDVIKPYILQGQVKTLNKVLSNIQMGIAVNTYAKSLGLTSIEQLKSKYIGLERVIYVGKPDWGIARKLDNILKHSILQLKNYKVIRLTNKQLESKLHRAELNKNPILFYSRKMNVVADKYAKNFLFDTIGVLEDIHSQMTIYSTIRYDLSRKCPKATDVVKGFRLDAYRF